MSPRTPWARGNRNSASKGVYCPRDGALLHATLRAVAHSLGSDMRKAVRKSGFRLVILFVGVFVFCVGVCWCVLVFFVVFLFFSVSRLLLIVLNGAERAETNVRLLCAFSFVT